MVAVSSARPSKTTGESALIRKVLVEVPLDLQALE